MGITYENRRSIFEKIAKRYKEYLSIYKEINNGSLEGITPFDEFYWRTVYYSRYPIHPS
jgi:hypothetical protein